MRIGVDVREFEPGARTGIGRYLMHFLSHAPFEAAGHHLHLYGTRRTALPRTPRGALVRRLPEPARLWWDQVALPRALAADRVDVFLSPYPKGPLGARCPVVVTVHDLISLAPLPGSCEPRLARAARRAATAAFARRAARVATVSETARAQIVARLRVEPERVVAVGNGVGPEFRPEAGGERLAAVRAALGIDGRYLLSVGNGRPHKNLGRLLEAFARIAGGAAAGALLVLAGPVGPVAAGLAERAERLGIGPRVRLPGRVADEDLPALYRGAELFVFPSLDEGFGLPPLEAMACGCPVVCARAGALPEVVGTAAHLVDPLDVDDLARGMAALLASPAERARLGALGRDRARRFDPETAARRLLALLESAAGAPAAGRRS